MKSTLLPDSELNKNRSGRAVADKNRGSTVAAVFGRQFLQPAHGIHHFAATG
jgi:hypothetical protein